jgi:glycerol dehydrogenase
VVEAATLLSGLGFESAGLAAAHAVHNGLTAIPVTHGLLHGEKVAFGTLVHLMLEAQRSTGEVARADAEAEAQRVAEFLVGVGLPVTLGELGIDAADAHAIAAVAERATAPGETIHAMPFPVDAAGVVTAIAAADAMGRAARGNQPS